MDKEQEIRTLQEQLDSINLKIKGDLSRILVIKTRLSTVYRRADKEKYEAELKEITLNLKKYREETDSLKRTIAELESTS